jgi:subtilisin family serine protease
MAQIGVLFRSVHQLIRELPYRELPYREPPYDFPLFQVPAGPMPVRLRIDEDGEVVIDLLATLAAEDPASREQALSNLTEHGFHVTTWTGRVAAGYAKVNDLEALESVEDDVIVEAAHVVYPELNVSVPEAWNRPAGWSGPEPAGDDVVVGIIDSGIDVTHPSFRTPAGTTRVVRLWDQAIYAPPLSGPPAAYPYGSEWDSAGIDAYLLPMMTPFSARVTGHGTAVAGVAASNGQAAPVGRYVGVAPSADLVVVALDAHRGAFPSTANVVNAVEYVFDVADALGKRAVVNLSQGAQLGPHDPRGQLELAITDLITADENRILVTSMGNVGDANAHARLDLPGAGSVDLEIDVPNNVGPFVVLDLWFDSADHLAVEVIDPAGNASSTVDANQRDFGRLGTDLYDIQGTPVVLGVQANEVQVMLRNVNHLGDVTPGRWIARLHSRHRTSGQPVHAWLERGLLASPRFRPPYADADYTATAPATADEILPVAAYSLSPTLGRFADFSSRGPDRRGRTLQGLSAPGDPITSCAASPFYTKAHVPDSGTSYAAAHVTGAIALLLQAEPTLTRKQVLDCLLQNARTDPDTAAGPATGWGAGKLDICAALSCATSIGA